MKNFSVHLDCTFSGNIEVTAETKEQAVEIAKKSITLPSDLRDHSFYFLDSEVVDIEKI